VIKVQKLIFLPAGIPVKRQRLIGFDPETKNSIWGDKIIKEDEFFFKLCDVCGTQITDNRRTHTCSNKCTEIKYKRIHDSELKSSTRGIFWHSYRFEALKRDNFSCQECGVKRRDQELDVHHIRPLSRGGTNELDNLITLCKECHKNKHRKYEGHSLSKSQASLGEYIIT